MTATELTTAIASALKEAEVELAVMGTVALEVTATEVRAVTLKEVMAAKAALEEKEVPVEKLLPALGPLTTAQMAAVRRSIPKVNPTRFFSGLQGIRLDALPKYSSELKALGLDFPDRMPSAKKSGSSRGK